MIKKNSLGLITILIFVIVFLLIQISFVSSEDIKTFTESTSIGDLFGLNKENITASAGIEYSEVKDSETEEKGARLTFIEENAEVNINGNLFTNIVSQKVSKHPTRIELDENGKIVKADFTVNKEGGNYIFENKTIEVPPNSRVFFDKDTGVKIKIPDGLDLTKFLGLFEYITEGYATEIEGNNLKLPNDVILNGKLSYESGDAFIERGSEVEINGVKIDNSYSLRRTKIFFDGKKQDLDFESYISFDFDNKKIVMEPYGISPIINFKENNPFIKIDEGDYFTLEPVNSMIEIQNRDSQGLIPEIIVKGKGFNIEEDGKSLFLLDNEIFLSKESNGPKDSTTTPVEITLLEKDGSPKFGKYEDIEKEIKGHKIFVDNFNRIAIVAEGKEEISRLKYNYITEEYIERLIGKDVEFYEDIKKGHKDAVLGRLRDYYNTLTPETKDSVEKITIASNEWFDREFIEDTNAVAYEGGEIKFRPDERFLLRTFKHEVAHQHHFSLGKRRRKRFDKQWKKIAGDIYGKISVEGENGYWGYLSKPGGKGPRDGVIRAYGASNLMEDVATFVGEVNNPYFFECLINPVCEDYDIRYRKKLDLLQEYYFISDSEYNKILEYGGVM